MNIIIKGTKIDLTPEVKEYIEEKITGLGKYFDKIIEARVEVGLTTAHHRTGSIYRAEINLRVPGTLLRVEKTTQNLLKAIDKAEDHMREELKRYKEKLRGDK
ncbi:MAG: ribosome-associated translation inhibitor RaiA [Patescibacteria group bacterium]